MQDKEKTSIKGTQVSDGDDLQDSAISQDL